MRYFDKYNLKQVAPQQLKEEYENFCSTTNGNGLYRFENLEDASSFLVVSKDKSYLVEKCYNSQDYIGLSTRISYTSNGDFYSVGENVFLKPQMEDEVKVEPIKSYEGFVISNGEQFELTQINAQFIYQGCRSAIEDACNVQAPIAAEQ